MSPKSLAHHLVRYQGVGRPSAALLGRLGAQHLRGRVLDLCGYMPDQVTVNVPNRIRPNASFRMTSAKGTDQIAWRLWVNGWNGFERPLPDLFAGAVRQAGTVFDIGANSGLYSMIAMAVSKHVLVHAFEPLPAASRIMMGNLRLNHVHARTTLSEAAVAEQSGFAELYVPAGNETLLEMSASLNGEFRARHAAVLRVEVVSIDDYAVQHKPASIDVMKIDVETQEHRVLLGAARVLDAHRPIIFLEVLPNAPVDALEAIRQKLAYQSIHLHETDVTRVSHVRVDPLSTNQVLCPIEKTSAFCAMAQSLGYPCIDETQVLVEVKDALVNTGAAAGSMVS